ncbi:hypothetical protein Dimus_010543 [Dionaea muscipula]
MLERGAKRWKKKEIERENCKQADELKEASNWDQKLHRENGELLKLAGTHRNTTSLMSVEVEEEKKKREKAKEKTKNFKKWEEEVKEEENKKRKQLHDEIDLQAKVDVESRTVQELNKVQSALMSVEKMVTTHNETIKEMRVENQNLKERVENNKKKRRYMTGVLNEYDERLKVNFVKEFIHCAKFKDGLARVTDLWVKNGFSFYTARVKDLMRRSKAVSLDFKGSEYGKRNCFSSRALHVIPRRLSAFSLITCKAAQFFQVFERLHRRRRVKG